LLNTCGRYSTVTAIGRKDEPQLRPISALIESESAGFGSDTEMLLRISLETQRQHVIRRALDLQGLVLLDRGTISLRSWVDHYGLALNDYQHSLSRLEQLVVTAPHLFCTADFETCWSRIDKPHRVKSKKEKLGKAINREFYRQYNRNARAFSERVGPMLVINTVRYSVRECVSYAIAELNRNLERGQANGA